MSNFTLYQRFNRHHMTERHLKLLDMMLEGATKKQLLDYLFPDRQTKYQGVSKFEDMLREISTTFGAPYKISGYRKNKEVIKENMAMYFEYMESKSLFENKKRELQKQIEALEEKEKLEIISKEGDFKDISWDDNYH